MWYHILLGYGKEQILTKTDLTIDEINVLFRQYKKNKTIRINGKRIKVANINRIFFSESEEKYDDVKDQIRAIRVKERYKKPNISDAEYFILHSREKTVSSLDFAVNDGHIVDEDKIKIFVVHGHDEGMLNSVARTLSRLDLFPIILKEKPNAGLTIIEKLEKYSGVQYAVILVSPDDVAYNKNETDIEKRRARQNVILELGWFMGKIGRDKVAILFKKHEDFDLPSDIQGMLYIGYDRGEGWKIELSKELVEAGIYVDLNKLLGLSAQ